MMMKMNSIDMKSLRLKWKIIVSKKEKKKKENLLDYSKSYPSNYNRLVCRCI